MAWITSGKFWVDAAERVLSTALFASSGLVMVDATGHFSVNWTVVAATAAIAGLGSFVKAVTKAQAVQDGSPPTP
jgi:hypothetical protein